MKHALSLLEAAAELILAVILISLLFWAGKNGIRTFTGVAEELNANTEALADSGITKYDGTEVTGSDVINAVRKYAAELPITVINTDTRIYGSGGLEFRLAENISGTSGYIDPFALYIGKLSYNQNKVMTGLTFTIRN